MVGDFNSPFTRDRTARQKVRKDNEGLNSTLNQQDLIDIYRAHHHRTADYTLFSRAHKMYTNIVHILGHRTNQNHFERIEIIQSGITNPSGDFKWEVNNWTIADKSPNIWELNSILLNNPWVERKNLKGT